MNDQEKRNRVKSALEGAGRGWLFNHPGPLMDKILDDTAQDVDKFIEEYQRRFGDRPDPFALFSSDPSKGKAFFQPDTLSASLEMKIMIWRILLGCEILEVNLQYHLEGPTVLSVALRTPYGEKESYTSQNLWDFRVLRHFGITGVNDRLVLQGYYALK